MSDWDGPEIGPDDVATSTGCLYAVAGAVIFVMVIGAICLIRLIAG